MMLHFHSRLVLLINVILFHPTLSTDRRRPFGQLPTTLNPIHYRLSVQPFFPADGITFDKHLNFTFHGNVSVLIECLDETDNITMHMDKIDITSDTVIMSDVDGGQSTLLSYYEYDSNSQQVSFNFGRSLEPGKQYQLNITYEGQLAAGDLSGLYTSSYVENGVTKWLAVTQFESTDARRALPCFDEPYYKAVFYVTIIHPTSMVALSNGLELGTEKLKDGWSVTTFTPTMKMSTYLLAMAVCDFRSKSNHTKDGKTLFRVWARPSFINYTDYAVAAGPKVLDYYSTYFGIPFPLSKQDMLAVPDFGAGAMENWGLVTYRETAVLYDEKVYHAMNRQRVAAVVAHELSHQWFGDLVTMDWWDDIWLNEGFATYMEHIGTDVISNGDMKMDSQFVSFAMRTALMADQLDMSHPIFVPVSSIDEIFEVFDDISYKKGGSIIRMLNYTLSSEVFQTGLHSYLTKRSYGNANHNNLWDSMTEAAFNSKIVNWNEDHLNVSDFMNPWILQMGYPVLNVQRVYDQPVKVAIITQHRFKLDENGQASNNTNPAFLTPVYIFMWHVPLWYQTEDSPAVQSAWLEANKTLTLFVPDDEKWLLVNYEAAAYCRVNYDERNWLMLHRQLKSDYTKITTKSRSQLVDDALQLARVGDLSYELALNLTAYLANETSMEPWQSAVFSLDYLNDMLALSSSNRHFRDYLLALTHNLYQRYGFNDSLEPIDDIPSHYLRSLAVAKQCRMGSADCIQTALVQFRLFLNACTHQNGSSSQCSNIYPGLRETIYCIGAQEDDEASIHWNLLWNLHAREEIAVEKLRLMTGLCCTKNISLINRLLNETISPNSPIRRQDVQFVFSSLSDNDAARSLLWPFIEEHWAELKKNFAKVGLHRMIVSATKSFNTEDQADKMQKFYNTHSKELGTVKRTYEQQMERAYANIRWMKNYGKIIIDWLKNYKFV